MENVNSIEKFIITDPCYIMDEKQYDKICKEDACDFEGQTFPLQSKHRYTKKPITFHIIEGTPNGDGSYTYKGQDIGVDAGMLCIAESSVGWGKAKEDSSFATTFGATFNTLAEAEAALPKIMRHF